MNIAIKGLSSEQVRSIIQGGGNVSIDLVAEVATVKIGKKTETVVADLTAQPAFVFDVTEAVAKLTAPEEEKAKPAKPAAKSADL